MILDVIVEDKKKRLAAAKARIGEEEMKARAYSCGHEIISFHDALAGEGLSIIGEFKKASPSMGDITMTMELTDRIDDYNASVDAISCLTEEDHFRGSTDYFRQIREMLAGIRLENACLKLSDLAVNGHDLMALGFQGKHIGQMLHFLLEQVVEETLPNEKEALLRAAGKRNSEKQTGECI